MAIDYPASAGRGKAAMFPEDGVRPLVTVLSSEESRNLYPLPIHKTGPQPVSLRAETDTERAFRLTPVSIDPDYLARREALMEPRCRPAKCRSPS